MAETVFFVVVGGSAAFVLVKSIGQLLYDAYSWIKDKYVESNWKKVTISINQNPFKFKKLSDDILDHFGTFRNHNNVYNFSIVNDDGTRKQYYVPYKTFAFDNDVQIEPFFNDNDIYGYNLWIPIDKEQTFVDFHNELDSFK